MVLHFCCVILCLSNTAIAFAENDESINQTDSISNAANENETSVNDENQVNKEEGENEKEENEEEKDIKSGRKRCNRFSWFRS